MIPTTAVLSASRAAVLAKKKAERSEAVRRLTGIGQDYATASRGRAASLMAEAQDSQARLAALQGETGAAAEGQGQAGGFFRPKVILIGAAVLAALFLLRRR